MSSNDFHVCPSEGAYDFDSPPARLARLHALAGASEVEAQFSVPHTILDPSWPGFGAAGLCHLGDAYFCATGLLFITGRGTSLNEVGLAAGLFGVAGGIVTAVGNRYEVKRIEREYRARAASAESLPLSPAAAFAELGGIFFPADEMERTRFIKDWRVAFAFRGRQCLLHAGHQATAERIVAWQPGAAASRRAAQGAGADQPFPALLEWAQRRDAEPWAGGVVARLGAAPDPWLSCCESTRPEILRTAVSRLSVLGTPEAAGLATAIRAHLHGRARRWLKACLAFCVLEVILLTLVRPASWFVPQSRLSPNEITISYVAYPLVFLSPLAALLCLLMWRSKSRLSPGA